jgi:hypothetical protein
MKSPKNKSVVDGAPSDTIASEALEWAYEEWDEQEPTLAQIFQSAAITDTLSIDGREIPIESIMRAIRERFLRTRTKANIEWQERRRYIRASWEGKERVHRALSARISKHCKHLRVPPEMTRFRYFTGVSWKEFCEIIESNFYDEWDWPNFGKRGARADG